MKDLLQLTVSMLKVLNIAVIDAWINVLKSLLKEKGILDGAEQRRDVENEIYDLANVCSPPQNKYAAMRIIAVMLDVSDSNQVDLKLAVS